MHLILTGATGLVGSAVLAHILSLNPASTSITRLSILSRSPVPMLAAASSSSKASNRTNTKTEIEVIHHTDYTSYPPELLAKLQGASGVIWAQGISQNEVDRDTYVAITKEYPLAAAKALSTVNGGDKPVTFVYVSGEGATLTPGMFTPTFGRVKGEAEAALLQLSKTEPYSSTLRPYSARPAGVDGSMQPEVWEAIVARRSWMWNMQMKVLLPPLRLVWPNMISPTPQLAQALVELAMKGGEPLEGHGIEGEGRTVRNTALRRMAGLELGWIGR